jgi:hypothetical protein
MKLLALFELIDLRAKLFHIYFGNSRFGFILLLHPSKVKSYSLIDGLNQACQLRRIEG